MPDINILLTSRLDRSNKAIDLLKNDIIEISKKLQGIELKLNIDSKSLSKLTGSFSEIEKVQMKIQKITQASKLSGEGYSDLQARVNEIKNSVDQYAKSTIHTYKNTNNLKSATIEYKNELGQLVKEQMKWVTVVNKMPDGSLVKKKIFQTTGNTLIEDFEKNAKRIENISKSLNQKLQSASNMGVKFSGLAPEQLAPLDKLLNRYKEIIKEFQNNNISGKLVSDKDLQKLQNLENAINRIYSKTKINSMDARGFNFEQYPKMANAIKEATNKQLYYNQSLLEGKKVINANVQETEKYIRVTQKLLQGTKVTTISAYINKATGETHKFSEAIQDTIKRSYSMQAALKNAFEKIAIWGVGTSAIYGFANAIRYVGEQIVLVDTKLVELSKVLSNDTDWTNLMNETAQSANVMARTLNEALDAEIEFGKQGFEASQAIDLARTSMLGANVTGLKTAEMAEYLTSALATFNIEASKSSTIIDKLNEVDNNFAVTSMGLAQSISKAGASAEEFGVSLSELIGMTTAINLSTRESGKQIGRNFAA